MVFKIGDYGLCQYMEAKEAAACKEKNSMHSPTQDKKLTFKFDVFSIGVVMLGAMLNMVVDLPQSKAKRNTLRDKLKKLPAPFGGIANVVEKMISEFAHRIEAREALRELCQLDATGYAVFVVFSSFLCSNELHAFGCGPSVRAVPVCRLRWF